MCIQGGRLCIPKRGWLRLAGSSLYAGCKPLTVRVRQESEGRTPKWYAYICHAVPAEQVKQPAGGALGVPRNVGQAVEVLALSTA